MTEIVQKYRELDEFLEQILARIDKVRMIMSAQNLDLLTPGVEDYRVKYLAQLHRHRRIVEQQQNELADQIDIEEVLSVMLQE